jgi:hypothetical protein
MFSKDKDREVARLSALANDLLDQLKMERSIWAQERREMLDRIMALTAPNAIRILRPQDPSNRERFIQSPPKSLLPGARPDMRPPIKPVEFTGPPEKAI